MEHVIQIQNLRSAIWTPHMTRSLRHFVSTLDVTKLQSKPFHLVSVFLDGDSLPSPDAWIKSMKVWRKWVCSRENIAYLDTVEFTARKSPHMHALVAYSNLKLSVLIDKGHKTFKMPELETRVSVEPVWKLSGVLSYFTKTTSNNKRNQRESNIPTSWERLD